MNDLELNKLIIIDRGGGRKGARGRTHRYTIRMDHLNDHCARPTDDAQSLRNFGASKDVNILHKPIDNPEISTCANDDSEMGNARPNEVNGFPTTPSSISLEDSLYGHHPKADSLSVSVKGLSKGKGNALPIQPFVETKANQASSTDHSDLAKLIGGGDDRAGWEALMQLPDGEVNKMARRFRYDKSSGPAILEQIRSLITKAAKHGAAH